MDAKKVAKAKSRKSVAARSPTLDLKTRDEVLEEQAKAEKELKKKEKLLKKGSKKGGDNITTLASTTGGDGPVGEWNHSDTLMFSHAMISCQF